MDIFQKERKTLNDSASLLLETAIKAGATQAEICGSFSERSRIVLEKQDYHLASSDAGFSFGVRVLIGDKQGFSSTNSNEPDSLKETAHGAVKNAKLSPPNPNVSIPVSGSLPIEHRMDLVDPELANLSVATQTDWMKGMISEATKNPRFRINEGSSDVSIGALVLTNSSGVHRMSTETAATWSLMGMGVEGSTITSFDYFSSLSRRSLDTARKIQSTTREFCQKVLKGLKTGQGQSYRGVVFFSPRAVSELLLSAVEFHLNGRNVVEKTSRWDSKDQGKVIFNEALSVLDDPWIEDRFGWSTFDREGTPTTRSSLIQQGKIENFMLDSYAAKALKSRSTGHAAGGSSSLPAVSSHCLNIAAGDTPISQLIQSVSQTQPDFLWVDRYSGQVNPITGDFSGVAKAAEWWSRGEFAFTVSETLISGNLFDVFGKNLRALSKEVEIVNCSESSPIVLCDNVSVTSAH